MVAVDFHVVVADFFNRNLLHILRAYMWSRENKKSTFVCCIFYLIIIITSQKMLEILSGAVCGAETAYVKDSFQDNSDVVSSAEAGARHVCVK